METLGAHLRNLLTPYKNLLQLVKDGKADEETIRKYNLDNLDELIAFSNSEAMEQNHNQESASKDLELFRTEYVDKEIERIYPNLSPHLPRKQKLRLNVFNGEDLEIAIDKATQWQKEQMMKDAIPALVKEGKRVKNTYVITSYVLFDGKYTKDSRIKMIVIPSDNKND